MKRVAKRAKTLKGNQPLKARQKQKQIKKLLQSEDAQYWRNVGCGMYDALQINPAPQCGPFAGAFGVVIGKGTVSEQTVLVAVNAMLPNSAAPNGMESTYIAVQMTRGNFQVLAKAKYAPTLETITQLKQKAEKQSLLICAEGFFSMRKDTELKPSVAGPPHVVSTEQPTETPAIDSAQV